MYFDEKTTVLIVEDSQTVRQGIRTMLSMAGITRSETANNGGEGHARLKSKTFDFVLCDYNLGEGKDGQELLEGMRRSGSLPLQTVWIMITGERTYERVVAAAEYGPDDYILKPFTSNILLSRMAAAKKRKEYLAPAHVQIESGQIEQSINTLKSLAQSAPVTTLRVDANRLRAELLLDEGRQGEALSIYQELLENKVIPWAKMGVAKIRADMGMQDESSKILAELIDDSPLYTDAYDLLAQNMIDDKQYAQAMEVLEKAVAISPRNFARLKSCGTAALRAGDAAKAAQYLQRAVEIGRNNDGFNTDILVELLHANCEIGNTQNIDKLQAEISASLNDRPESQFTLLTCRAMTTLLQKRWDESFKFLAEASGHLKRRYVDFGGAQRFLSACVKLTTSTVEQAEKVLDWTKVITQRFGYTKHEIGTLIEIARNSVGCTECIEAAYAEIQSKSNQAVELTAKGKSMDASLIMYAMASETMNERLGMNACAIMLKAIDTAHAAGESTTLTVRMATEIIAWLPADNERVRGFASRLQKEPTTKATA